MVVYVHISAKCFFFKLIQLFTFKFRLEFTKIKQSLNNFATSDPPVDDLSLNNIVLGISLSDLKFLI